LTFNRVFRDETPKDAIDLIKQMIKYDPMSRASALDLLGHDFFTQLRDSNFKLSDGTEVKDLWKFTREEIPDDKSMNKILPGWELDFK